MTVDPSSTLTTDAQDAYLRFVGQATFDHAYDAASYVPSLAREVRRLTAALAEVAALADAASPLHDERETRGYWRAQEDVRAILARTEQTGDDRG